MQLDIETNFSGYEILKEVFLFGLKGYNIQDATYDKTRFYRRQVAIKECIVRVLYL